MNYETILDYRLDAILEAANSDDIPFLVACVRHWRDRCNDAPARRRERCAAIAEKVGAGGDPYCCETIAAQIAAGIREGGAP